MKAIQLQPELQKAADELGYSVWTDIQLRTMPLIQEGRDVIGQSRTGSGKTAAFGLPLLEKTIHRAGLQALILVPTRELCEQVMSELHKFAKHKRMNILAIYGGVSIDPQIKKLQTADVVVGTPGRILDHLSRQTLDIRKIRTVVLDEADKMFEMGFIDDVKRILSPLPPHQTMLFSATINQDVHMIAKHFMHNPETIKVQSYVDHSKMGQEFYAISSRDKFSLLVHLLKTEQPSLAIIFCATRDRVDMVNRNLYKNGIQSQALHGGLSQNRRKNAMDLFHQGKVNILVASDVAARGLDIQNVSHVINFDIPNSSKEYIHRIGRTARAGKEGKVVSLVAEPDHDNFRSILGDSSLNITQMQIPQFERIHLMPHRHAEHGRGNFQRRRSFSHHRR